MIIFMGVVGAGKSVQGRMLADELGLPWLSTGEFLRMLISGQRRKDMVAGKLLPDNEIISLVQKIFAVIDRDEEFILDGFPRSVPQADWLLSQIKYGQLKATAVINLKADEESVKRRLLERGRPDDNEQAIDERLDEYRTTTLPMLEQLRKAGVPVYDIDGNQSIEEVNQAIKNALAVQ